MYKGDMTDAHGSALAHPRQVSELVGHAEAEAMLLGAWQSGRLPHAWLITGPPGIGKATLAYRFARFVLSGGGGTLLSIRRSRWRGASRREATPTCT
jgi:DNA polymerase-3 subunit delta'